MDLTSIEDEILAIQRQIVNDDAKLRLIEGKTKNGDYLSPAAKKKAPASHASKSTGPGGEPTQALTNNSDQNEDKYDFSHADKSKFELKCKKMDLQTKLLELQAFMQLNSFKNKMKQRTHVKSQSKT